MTYGATEPVAVLVKAYLDFATTEVKSEGGKPRSAGTMSGYRKGLEGFVSAVEKSGLTLAELPEDFLETQWLATQESVLKQSVQLRIRATAVSRFRKWLTLHDIPCAPMRDLKISTPAHKPSPPSPPQPKEFPMSNHLQDVSQLGDASREADPIPSTQTYQPPLVSVQPPPPQRPVQQPQSQQAQQQRQMRDNPLASMMPTGQFKLRVRRERENDTDVFVGDYLSERVKMVGAIEPFLAREVAPAVRAQGITGDVSFLVSAVSPAGHEGEKTRYVISVPAIAPVVAPVAPFVPQQQSAREEIADLISTSHRASEELAERLAQRIGTQTTQATQERSSMSEMDELKQMVRGLAGTVRDLTERLESRDSQRYEQSPKPVEPAVPQLDILKVLEAVDTMHARRASTAPAPAPTLGFPDMVKMMADMKGMFQPQNIQVDTSALEDEMREIRREQQSKPKGLIDTLKEFKEAKELFQMVGGETSSPRPTLGQALGGMFMKFLENPAPIAEAAERVLLAAKGVASSATQTTSEKPKFPPQVIAATNALLHAQDPNAAVLAAHEWMSLLAQMPAFTKPVQRMSELLREGNVNGLGIFMQQIFKGLGAQVAPERCAQLAQVLVSQLPGVKAMGTDAAEGEEGEEGEEEGDEEGEEEQASGPDMTIKVGGVHEEEAEDDDGEEAAADDAAEDETGGDGDEDGGDGEEAPAEADGGEDEQGVVQDDAKGPATPEEGGDEEPSPEEIEEAVTETKSQRRKRRKAEKEAAALVTPVEVQKFDKPTARS